MRSRPKKIKEDLKDVLPHERGDKTGVRAVSPPLVDKEAKSLPDYEWWVNYKGIWELKDAANLYLGLCPEKGGAFYEFTDLLGAHNTGLILTDSETVWPVQMLKNKSERVEWNDIFDQRGENKISLNNFIKGKIAVGEIEPVSFDGLPHELYFKPIEIIQLFQKYFLNNPPHELLNTLGFKNGRERLTAKERVKKLAQERGPEIINRFYKQHRKEPKKAWVTTQLHKMLSDIDEATFDRSYSLTEMKKEAFGSNMKCNTVQ